MSERLVDSPEYRLLARNFYDRQTIEVSKDLLGKLLVRRYTNNLLFARIVEVEAYLGEHDPAAHASFGKTDRTQVLYGQPGHAYIFQIRGHNCLNAVAEGENSPGCVLIRAAEPVEGIEQMRQLRIKKNPKDIELTNGPGKLCQALNITMEHYGADLTSENSGLQICEPLETMDLEIETSKRIGITKAADWDLRFTLKGNKFISR